MNESTPDGSRLSVALPSGIARERGLRKTVTAHETARADERLMEAVQQGDREAFGRLVARHKVPVLNFLYRYTLDRDLAEDLSQEVFLRVFRDAGSFDPRRGKVSTWMYTVARNLARDVARRKRFEIKANTAFCERRGRFRDVDVESGWSDDPVLSLERKETIRAVRASLARLPEKYRAVFVLCELQGLSYGETGAVVGCSEKTISSRLSRARERFRRELDQIVGRRPTHRDS